MKLSRRILSRYVANELLNGQNHSRVVESLAAYIVEHRLQNQVEQIVADVASNLASMGHVEATVTTARPLGDELRGEILAYVQHIEGSKHVTLSETVEPAILGGVIIETPGKRFDASVSTKLKRLKSA